MTLWWYATNNNRTYTVSLIRWRVLLMSSGSWKLRDTEPGSRVLDAPAARFLRRGTCHSSPVSVICCYLTVLGLLSIYVQYTRDGRSCFPCKTRNECYWLLSSFLLQTLIRLRLVNSIVNTLAPPSVAEYNTAVVNIFQTFFFLQ